MNHPHYFHQYINNIAELRNNQRRPDTISETEETYKDLIEFIGDKPIDQYTRVDGRNYRKHLEKLPKNRKRVPKYRDKNLKEIHSSPVPLKDKISKDTQIKLISRMTSCWNFLIKNIQNLSQRMSSRRNLRMSQLGNRRINDSPSPNPV